MNIAQLKSRAISKEGLGLAKGVCDSIAFLTDPVEQKFSLRCHSVDLA